VEYIYAGVTAIIGGVVLAAGLKGYMIRRTFIIERLLLLIAGISLIDTKLVINILTLAIVCGIVIMQVLIKEKKVNEIASS